MTDICVVGAGPGGLLSALLAARSGGRVVCHEKQPQLRSRGCWLVAAPVQRLLEQIGIELAGKPCSSLSLCDEKGHSLFALDYPQQDKALCVSRQHLLDQLAAAARQAGVELYLGSELVEPPVADLIIGADGCRSQVRRWAQIPTYHRSLGRYYRGVTELNLEIGQPREIWTADGRRFGVDPNDRGLAFYCTAPAEDPQDWQQYVNGWRAPLARRVLSACPLEELDECRPLDVWAHRWSRPPYFLVGDAAHGQPPNLGQGANLAMLDAFRLQRLRQQSRDLEQLHRNYNRNHLPRHALHLLSVAACWFSHFPPTFRDGVVRGLAGSATVKQLLARLIVYGRETEINHDRAPTTQETADSLRAKCA